MGSELYSSGLWAAGLGLKACNRRVQNRFCLGNEDVNKPYKPSTLKNSIILRSISPYKHVILEPSLKHSATVDSLDWHANLLVGPGSTPHLQSIPTPIFHRA